MCFPKAAVCWDIFQTFYSDLNCLTADQILIPLNHMLQHMFHRLLDNGSTLVCFDAVILSAGLLYSFSYMLNLSSKFRPLTGHITEGTLW